jgi:hypothetical protein
MRLRIDVTTQLSSEKCQFGVGAGNINCGETILRIASLLEEETPVTIMAALTQSLDLINTIASLLPSRGLQLLLLFSQLIAVCSLDKTCH